MARLQPPPAAYSPSTAHQRRSRLSAGFSFRCSTSINPLSLHETTLYAGTETSMWYANHIEAVLCIEGEAELTNDETGEKHWITPGTMYLLDDHERHTMRPKTDFRCICVFNPPVTGREDHDENGVYPLLTEDTDD